MTYRTTDDLSLLCDNRHHYIARCISADLNVYHGDEKLHKEVKEIFKDRTPEWDKSKDPGECLYCNYNFFLVVKRDNKSKATMGALRNALLSMRDVIGNERITIVMPDLKCKVLLDEIFGGGGCDFIIANMGDV